MKTDLYQSFSLDSSFNSLGWSSIVSLADHFAYTFRPIRLTEIMQHACAHCTMRDLPWGTWVNNYGNNTRFLKLKQLFSGSDNNLVRNPIRLTLLWCMVYWPRCCFQVWQCMTPRLSITSHVTATLIFIFRPNSSVSAGPCGRSIISKFDQIIIWNHFHSNSNIEGLCMR